MAKISSRKKKSFFLKEIPKGGSNCYSEPKVRIMGKKMTVASASKATTPARRKAQSVFRRTATNDRAGLGFFPGTSRAFHHRNGMNVGKTSCVIIATAVQQGVAHVIRRILERRAVLQTPGQTISLEEAAEAIRSARANHEIMYSPVIPDSSVRQVVDDQHESYLTLRTKRAEAAQLKREKAKKAAADAAKAAGVPTLKKVRKVAAKEDA